MWGGVYTKMVQTSQDCCSLPPSRSRPGMKEMAPTVTWWSTQKWYRHPQQAEALLSLLSEVILGNKEMTLPVVWGSTQRWYEHSESSPSCCCSVFFSTSCHLVQQRNGTYCWVRKMAPTAEWGSIQNGINVPFNLALPPSPPPISFQGLWRSVPFHSNYMDFWKIRIQNLCIVIPKKRKGFQCTHYRIFICTLNVGRCTQKWYKHHHKIAALSLLQEVILGMKEMTQYWWVGGTFWLIMGQQDLPRGPSYLLWWQNLPKWPNKSCDSRIYQSDLLTIPVMAELTKVTF